MNKAGGGEKFFLSFARSLSSATNLLQIKRKILRRKRIAKLPRVRQQKGDGEKVFLSFVRFLSSGSMKTNKSLVSSVRCGRNVDLAIGCV